MKSYFSLIFVKGISQKLEANIMHIEKNSKGKLQQMKPSLKTQKQTEYDHTSHENKIQKTA